MLFRTKIESVTVPYTQAERTAVTRHLQTFEEHCRSVHMDSRAVAYARIAMNPNKVEQIEISPSKFCRPHPQNFPLKFAFIFGASNVL